VSVRGSGVLDKRSFLASDSTASADPPAERDPFDTAEDTGGGSLVPYIVGLAVLLLAGALLWDRRSRSQATRTRAGRRR
jgi:hypothetical protein